MIPESVLDESKETFECEETHSTKHFNLVENVRFNGLLKKGQFIRKACKHFLQSRWHRHQRLANVKTNIDLVMSMSHCTGGQVPV